MEAEFLGPKPLEHLKGGMKVGLRIFYIRTRNLGLPHLPSSHPWSPLNALNSHTPSAFVLNLDFMMLPKMLSTDTVEGRTMLKHMNLKRLKEW